jgi:hypothetical protein
MNKILDLQMTETQIVSGGDYTVSFCGYMPGGILRYFPLSPFGVIVGKNLPAPVSVRELPVITGIE